MYDNMEDIKIGCPRNDGIKRIYTAHSNGNIYEYYFNGSVWTLDSIVTGSGSVDCLEIGIGRNDGIERIYTPACSNMLHEIFYSTGNWQIIQFGWVPGGYSGIAVGDGKNVNLNRIYSWSFCDIDSFVLYEWRRQGGSWYSTVLGFSSQWGDFNMAIGKGRGDTIDRVYTATGFNLYETCFQSTSWVNTIIDSLNSNLSKPYIGKGRNDSMDRLYVGCNDVISEYFYVPQGVIGFEMDKISKKENIDIFPNPLSNKGIICYNLKAGTFMSINIYNLLGEKVNCIYEGFQMPGNHKCIFNVSSFSPGIYIINVNTGLIKYYRKITIL